MSVTGTNISLTLRQVKGSELTHKELDDNQAGLKTAVESHSHDEFAPALGADDNYVTDAEKTKLSNLSGTNTGDQDLTGLLNETSHDLLDHTGLTGVPAAYTLPTASTTVLGGVKVDGTTILIEDGVISSTGGTGGVAETYTNITPVPTTIGGISSGTTFDSKTMTEMWNSLLYPYQSPTFSNFSFGQSSPIEVGTTLTGNKTFTWATTNSSNISSNSISILDVTGSSTLASGLANDGSEVLSVGTVQKTSATSHAWRISAVNTNSVTFTRDVSIAWQWRRFYGESTTTPLIESEIEALRVSGLATGFSGTYSFVGGGYKYLCYPTSFGTATTFKDQSTNLDVPFETPYIVNITNVNGIATDYRVHRSTNILGAAINIVVS